MIDLPASEDYWASAASPNETPRLGLAWTDAGGFQHAVILGAGRAYHCFGGMISEIKAGDLLRATGVGTLEQVDG